MGGDRHDSGHDLGGPQLDGADSSTGGVRPAGLVGRASALAALDRAVGEAAAGGGGLVFVTGEAGIGKTALARQIAQHALQRGVLVLWGSCREDPGVPGLWPWVEVLRAYAERVGRRGLSRQLGDAASGLAGLVPELGPGPAMTGTASAGPGVGAERAGGGTGPPPDPASTGAADRFRMFDAVATLLRRGTVARPLLVVLDDLQWADAGTLRLLRFLVPDLSRSRLLVVGA